MSSLPAGWMLVKVEELATNEPGALTDGPFGSNLKTSHYTTSGPRVIRLQNIGDGVFIDERAHIAQDHFEDLRKYEVEAGDVVVAMLGEDLPRACLVPNYVGPAIVKADCVRLRVHPSLSRAYVVRALNSRHVRSQAAELVHGLGRPRLGLKWFRKLEVPLAPAQEQEQIAQALDSYLTRLDDAGATLEHVARNLQHYRASVLQAAVEGRLVPTEAELARAEGRDYEHASVLLKRLVAARYRRHSAAPQTIAGQRDRVELTTEGLTDLSGLPEGWVWSNLDTLAEVKGGITKGQKPKQGEKYREVPYLRVANVQRGYLDLTRVKLILASEKQIEELSLRPGDVLLNEGGDRDKLGRGWVWRGEIDECIHQNHVFRARMFTDDLLPEFLSWYANTIGQSYFIEQGKQTTNLASINMTKLRSLPVPIPPLAEQIRIRQAVGERLSVADSALHSVAQQRARCTRLRQSILKWAFEGKLVDQDASDEPASALLERIRTERQSLDRGRPAARGRRAAHAKATSRRRTSDEHTERS